MSTYVVGDIQGCYDTLQALLMRVQFKRESDRLWLVGDLVNRGPRSLEVLRLLKSLDDCVVAVLGNHDMHFLARHARLAEEKPRDTLDALLSAPDVDNLVAWLESRPLLHREGPYTMVHAGLLPSWTIDDATREARALEASLRDPRTRTATLAKAIAPASLRALTTLRTCQPDGTLCKHSGTPETAPAGCVPWFDHPARRSKGHTVIFGHWSALGFKRGGDYLALDTGCVWGKELTAVRLEDGVRFSETARETPAQD